MTPKLLPLLVLVLAAPAAVATAQQQPEWRQSAEYDVLLRPFAYEPRVIRLDAGRPVRLRFVNSGQAPLTFRAPEFFRRSQVRAGDADLVAAGSLSLAPGERRTIVLVPQAGRYRVRSANLMHRLLGMSGEIVVE